MTRRAILVLCAVLFTLGAARFDAALWIESVSDSGEIIILSDDSAWEVDILDQNKASLWLPIQRVAIAKTSTTGVYRIVRERQGDSVRAQRLR